MEKIYFIYFFEKKEAAEQRAPLGQASYRENGNKYARDEGFKVTDSFVRKGFIDLPDTNHPLMPRGSAKNNNKTEQAFRGKT